MSRHAAHSGLDQVDISGVWRREYDSILTPAALSFIADLQRTFNADLNALRSRRRTAQAEFDAGFTPDFLPATRTIREGKWRVAPIPRDLRDRRVEITGPTDRKMVINALNSGASAFLADFEDANAPTWSNMLEGQINLRDAVDRTITWTSETNRRYTLNDDIATLLVRPRGWALPERHMQVDGEPMSGALFDFGLYFFHNARRLLDNGSGPYFYLPKLESHLEARLWNDVFQYTQDILGFPRGSIRATVLIEHLSAAFEAEEILHELREHASGLNCGRWDYIFSIIKRFRANPDYVFPDRAQVTMTTPCMEAYYRHVIRVCHKRGAHAIGGMAAQIPVRNDPVANEAALAKVRADKIREATEGHDGTWVAHPGLVPVAKEVFDKHMPNPNQIDRRRDDVRVRAADLIAVPTGSITEEGLRINVNVGVQYLESWLRGIGCVPLYHLMEDAATAEISRSQVWQWIRHERGVLVDGRRITKALFRRILSEELGEIESALGAKRCRSGRFETASRLFDRVSTADVLPDFLTLVAYDELEDGSDGRTRQ